ncbi:hypothetical protein [Microbacterium sp.]|uniref:hypothetical protein n=1 Tax=Microbacterium sp. TaxID=51671 RepID=UPI001AD14251|nr:hypothetical protein [Microbacterium sp.]MBN9156930.1 hypothetical protein [Microbacterium sp.]
MTNHETPDGTYPAQREQDDHETKDPVSRSVDAWARLIQGSLDAARHELRDIDLSTARAIAHVLGFTLGRSSALAGFARTGEGSYTELRDEYLSLYADLETPPEVRRWISWLGTFLVQREGSGTTRRFMNEHLDPQLERVLVRTSLPTEDGGVQWAQVPATLTTRQIIAVGAQLATLEEWQNDAFHAFLTLADVSAADPNLTESFRETYRGSYPHVEDAVRDLTEVATWEEELEQFADDRGLPRAAVRLEYDVITDLVRDTFDFVERGWNIHVFEK